MCIIAHKPKDVPITEAFLKDITERNSHGFGMGVYSRGKKTSSVSVGKTMSAQELIAQALKWQNHELIIHCRIKTHGDISKDNCHPFEVSPGVYLMHNGTVQHPDSANKSMSDTAIFAETLIKPILADKPNVPEFIRSVEFKRIVDFLIKGWNRVCLFDKDGVVKFGEGWSKTVSGIEVSNTNYTADKPVYIPPVKKSYTPSTTYPTGPYGTAYFDQFAFDGESWYKKSDRAIKPNASTPADQCALPAPKEEPVGSPVMADPLEKDAKENKSDITPPVLKAVANDLKDESETATDSAFVAYSVTDVLEYLDAQAVDKPIENGLLDLMESYPQPFARFVWNILCERYAEEICETMETMPKEKIKA